MMIRNVIAKVWIVVHIAALNFFQKSFQVWSLWRNMLTAIRTRARNAPIAADWLTENTPVNMPPSTTPNRITTPIRPFRDTRRSFQVNFSPRGASFGLRSTCRMIVAMHRTAIMIPGRTPAMKSFPMLASAMMQ